MEQHYLHCRGSEKSAAEYSAFTRHGYGHGHRSVPAGESWLSLHASAECDPTCGIRSRRYGHFAGRVSGAGRYFDGFGYHGFYFWVHQWDVAHGFSGLLRHGARWIVLPADWNSESGWGAGDRFAGAGLVGCVSGFASHLRSAQRQIWQPLQQLAGLRRLRCADFLHFDDYWDFPVATQEAIGGAALQDVWLSCGAGALHCWG